MTPSQLSTTDLLAGVKSANLFGEIDEAIWQTIAPSLEPVFLKAEETLFRQGDPGDSFYVIISGHLYAAVQDQAGNEKTIHEMKSGEIVGEMAMFTNEARTASIYAMRDCELVKLPKRAFEQLVEKVPSVLQQVAQLIRQRLRTRQLAVMLPNLFGSLDTEMLQKIEAKAEWVFLSRGECLFRQRDPGDSFYVIISGRLYAAIQEQAGNEKIVGEIKSGESVGEMAMFTSEARTASIYAIRDCALVKFSKLSFEQLVAEHPKILMKMTQLIVWRLQNTSASKSVSRITNIAVIPVDANVPLTDFTQRLVNILSRFDSTLHLNSERLNSLLGTQHLAQIPKEHPNNLRIATWLDDQETKHRFIIYEGDTSYSPWTRRCLQRADQVLIAGQARGHHQLGEIEVKLFQEHQQITGAKPILVLLHSDDKLPSGTKKWLDNRPALKRHHHIRFHHPNDFERLARFLAGRAMGLALSGGGARGFAHIGAIRAFEEAGIHFDFVGGTSMGSIIAGEYALGWNTDFMISQNKRYLQTFVPVSDLTFPILSLSTGQAPTRLLQKLFGEVLIEDLWLPYFCVSTNLSRAEMVIFQKGALARSTRASCSVPGVLPPVIQNGDLLVDGAFLKNLPADLMSQFCEGGPVVAIDVSPPIDLMNNTDYGDKLSGRKLLLNKINPLAKPMTIPNIMDIMQRVGDIGSLAQLKTIQEISALYISMPVENIGVVDFKSIDKIVEIGYRTTKQKIAQWQR